MGQRLQFQAHLESLGPEKVYFQEPAQDKMVYPCIVYHIDEESVKFADNNPYNRVLGYQTTLIVRDPDSPLRDKIASMPMTTFNRFFVVNGLNHFVYKSFF